MPWPLLGLVGLALLALLPLALLAASLLARLLLLPLLAPGAAVAVRLALGAALLVDLIPGAAELSLRDHVPAARGHLVREVGHGLGGLLVVAACQGVGGAALGLGELRRVGGVVGGLAERLGKLILRLLGELIGLGAKLGDLAGGLLVVAASERLGGLVAGRDLVHRLPEPVERLLIGP